MIRKNRNLECGYGQHAAGSCQLKLKPVAAKDQKAISERPHGENNAENLLMME